jgi:4-hydroxy-tetrahydrodipicolinate synthase
MRGIHAAVITPVENSGGISIERLARHCRWLLRQGCHGLAIFGTTSEAQAFSIDERKATLDALLASGLEPDLLSIGTGLCARADTVSLTKHALAAGCTNILMLPPFFYKNVPDDGVFAAFAEVIEAVGDERMDIYLYHFPQMSAVPINKPVIERLLKTYPSVVKGLKDSSGNWEHAKDLVESFPGFEVFVGSDKQLLDLLETGGQGTISAAANLNCEASRAVFDAFEAGDMAAAKDGMTMVTAVREALEGYPLIPAIKYVISEGMHDEVWQTVRPPLMRLDEAEGRKLVEALDECGYAYDPDLYSVAGA